MAENLTQLITEASEPLPQVSASHPLSEALLVETWNQLTVGFAEPSEENPGRHRPIALEVEQDTLDEMAMVEHSKADQAKPSTAEADFKPIESEVLSGKNVQQNIAEPTAGHKNTSPSPVGSDRPEKNETASDEATVERLQPVEAKNSKLVVSVSKSIGILLLCLMALAGGVWSGLGTQWVLPMYVVGVAGTVALTAGWILGRPVFRKRSRLLEVGHSTFAMLALVTLGAFVSAPVLLEMSFLKLTLLIIVWGSLILTMPFLPLRREQTGLLGCLQFLPVNMV